MYKTVSCLLVTLLVQLAAARFYKPRPLFCPVFHDVEYVDEVLRAKEIEVLHVPLPINQVNLNTVYKTSEVLVTSVIFQTLTAPPQQLVVADIQLVEQTDTLARVKVSTVTSSLTQTRVDVITSSATNYHTEFQTIPVYQTSHDIDTQVNTIFTQVTQTLPTTFYSTVTVTDVQLQTETVVETVSVTRDTFLVTETVVRDFTNTHSLTKMITSTVCLPQPL